MPEASAPTSRPGIARPLTLVLASGAAIVGVVLLLVALVTVGTRSLEATESGDVPCLQAVDADVAGAAVRNEVLPPRAVCTWTDASGTAETVVVAEASPVLFWAGLVLFVGGVLTCVGVLVAPRLRR
ncbi:hypothetical protein KIN34_13770 [Cellulomonas sp. DKR-3]|uniref:Integral membrane protein n=1 Tax=Cellulomonas fulva TaxID=2835530 RepID=A0ABS5U1X2_9CELL|nr:hypothetical protein [Cellulomonas fulva]MBT0995352.1 hypothetical protein [Cellulomonas fulva]